MHYKVVQSPIKREYIQPSYVEREAIINRIHRNSGHLNGENLRDQILMQGYKWPAMLKQVKAVTKRNCKSCRELSNPKVTFLSLRMSVFFFLIF